MKVKVTMICILKSGAKITETIKVSRKDKRVFETINAMRKGIEESLGYEKPAVQSFTFGKATILISEIAGITFKEN